MSDGTAFHSVATSGDVTIGWNGAMAISASKMKPARKTPVSLLSAESPAVRDASGQEKGLKVTFSINVHLNEKIDKKIDLKPYTTLSAIRTLAITGAQGRDDDFLGIIHRLGLPVSVTSFQKQTISQIQTNLNSSAERYILLILFDEPEADGFEAGKALLDENPAPTDDEIKEALAGTFCRCTGHIKIMEAVKKASHPAGEKE